MTKEPKGSFLLPGKEPVIERVFQLVERYPSRSAAARAWGINVNTLKNYYRRKDIHPIPRYAQLVKIAEVEGVSVEWLTTGEGKEPENTKRNPLDSGGLRISGDLERLTEMLSYLSEEERKGLLETLTRKGIETVLYLLDENNIRLLQLDDVVKEKILGLQPRTPEEAARATAKTKECGADNSAQATSDSPASMKRQAS